jgi:hypothetical protein
MMTVPGADGCDRPVDDGGDATLFPAINGNDCVTKSKSRGSLAPWRSTIN